MDKNAGKLGFFRFKKFKNRVLLTNDIGDFISLNNKEFDNFTNGKIKKGDKKFIELKKKNFIRNDKLVELFIEKYKIKKNYLFSGPSLHIVVLTTACNYNCIYCQTSSSAGNAGESCGTMTKETAQKIVDFIFNSPNNKIAIEFQGGEPMINWSVLEYITKYAISKNKEAKKDLELRLVSNLSKMTEKRLEFCFDNRISISTSLDGPEELHNQNRPSANCNSYEQTTKWLGRAMKIYYNEYYKKRSTKYYFQPSAIVTTSRLSLEKPKEIIDEYAKWGFEVIFLRPLSPIGFADKAWEKIGYSAQEYIDFYKQALNYILKLNKDGRYFVERTASIILSKILTPYDPNYLEMRSPCGAGIGQLAYNYNGNIFPCDEARMIEDKNLLKLGNVDTEKFKDIMDNPITKTLCSASELEANPKCAYCVYLPYCGICPVYNYAKDGSLVGSGEKNDRCIINEGIIEYIFEKMEDKVNKEIFSQWADSEMDKGNKY